MASTFDPLVPTGRVKLNQDYSNVQKNFNQLNTTYSVDHIPLTDPDSQNGYHKALHMVDPGAPLTPVATVGQLFNSNQNDGINTDTELFWLTGNGLLLQLTRNFVPTAATNGYTFLPGGLIMQWGAIAATNTNPTVVFTSSGNINFPNAIYNIQVTRQHAPSSPGSNSMWVSTTGLTTSGFTIKNDDGHTWSYNWMAIGR